MLLKCVEENRKRELQLYRIVSISKIYNILCYVTKVVILVNFIIIIVYGIKHKCLYECLKRTYCNIRIKMYFKMERGKLVILVHGQ